jgi:F0F1-type ATP synthase gamma subunit
MPTPLLFKGVSLIASLSVGKVVTDVIRNNVVSTGAVSKTAHWVGSLVLGAMAMDQASKHIDEGLKKLAEEYEKSKQEQNDEPESSIEAEAS